MSKYKRLSDVEHVLKRPDTFVGSMEPVHWETVNGIRQVVPALYKIFDEVLVNATDNISRGKTNIIKVEINDHAFSVWNNGKCIPVVTHKKEKMWTPSLVFGFLRTSNNYDDNEERLTGGRNGYGAKLANIFSTKFTVRIQDKKKYFEQEWTNNMKAGKPIVRDQTGETYTCVACHIDLQRFGLTKIPLETQHIMFQRVYDLKMIYPDLTIQFRRKIHETNLDSMTADLPSEIDYLSRFMVPLFRQKNKRWSLIVGYHDEGEFQQQSFVNGIWTRNGGTHVNYILRQVDDILEPVRKKLNLKKYEMHRKMAIFLSCQLVNPCFDSQIKESCTLPEKKFGSEFKVQKRLLADVQKSELMGYFSDMAKSKEQKKLSKQDGKKRKVIDVPKLTDASKAGTSKSKDCTLVLTEGDSANALALAGMAVVGSKLYGSYPLKGKILNGYTAGVDKWSKNAVITDVIKCLGLKHGVKYRDTKTLRYGSILVMADQDTDGFHIRGLVFSLFGSHWPELLLIPGFIKVMRTPLVKAFKGKRMVKEFFNELIAQEYIDAHPEFHYKFYKGLGTSTSAEAKEMFRHLDKYTFAMQVECPDALKKAFEDNDAAKRWRKDIVTRPPYNGVNRDRDGKSYQSFVSGPWVEHARASNERSIPDIHDGLKPVQRKILYTMMKGKNKEIKVAQLNGKVAMETHYHHGEMNVGNAIVNMAQDFVGSNNLPYLQPLGQFGTRHKGGADHASHRYIFTKLQPWVKYAFPEADLPVLDYNVVDGHTVEPHNFVPIIPMLLVNGAAGIGCGWATDIPKFNQIQVIDAVLNGQYNISPWYNNFMGDIRDGKTWADYTIEDSTCTISELPIGVWTSTFKEKLKKLDIRFTESHTDTTVRFVIDRNNGLQKLPLSNNIKQNWVAFCHDRIRKTTLVEVFRTHAEERLALYSKRKQYQLNEMETDMVEKNNRMRFIEQCLAGKVPITEKTYDECVAVCEQLGIDPKYLDIRLRDITPDAVLSLKEGILKLQERITVLKATTEKQMWQKELTELRNHLVPSQKRKREEIDLTKD